MNVLVKWGQNTNALFFTLLTLSLMLFFGIFTVYPTVTVISEDERLVPNAGSSTSGRLALKQQLSEEQKQIFGSSSQVKCQVDVKTKGN